MLAESLVIFSCLKSVGCSETSAQYFHTYPDVREMIENNGKKVEQFIGPSVVQTIGPVLYAASGGTGTVRINKNFSLQISLKNSILTFNKEF